MFVNLTDFDVGKLKLVNFPGDLKEIHEVKKTSDIKPEVFKIVDCGNLSFKIIIFEILETTLYIMYAYGLYERLLGNRL